MIHNVNEVKALKWGQLSPPWEQKRLRNFGEDLTINNMNEETNLHSTPPPTPRPNVFEYRASADFVAAMLTWRKHEDPRFSLRSASQTMPGSSRTLVARIAKGQRRLTRDRIDDLAILLQLTLHERAQLERLVVAERKPGASVKSGATNLRVEKDPPKVTRAAPQNHLLADWLNIYIKDACKLRSFSPQPERIHELLGGLATTSHIQRSLDFLLREGYLRRTPAGKLVQNDAVTTSTDGLPNEKIRSFHKKALEIARQNIDRVPLTKRREAAFVLHLNEPTLVKLTQLFDEICETLIQFAESHPDDNEKLYQILINLTPIGG